MKKCSASVVLYNTAENEIKRLIDCVWSSGVIEELFIIDNSQFPVKYESFNRTKIKYIHTGKNIGYGSAHNIAIKRNLYKYKYHFVLNPDICFDPANIKIMLNRMEEDNSIGQLMPKVLYPNGSLQYLCKLIPTPYDLFIRRFISEKYNYFEKSKERFELCFTKYEKEMNVPYLSGCFMLFRCSALLEIGLFDERYFMYAEDIDITRRMHEKYKTLFYPDVVVVHDHAKASYKSKKMLYIHICSIIKYFNKWGWFFDKKRKQYNERLLRSLGYE